MSDDCLCGEEDCLFFGSGYEWCRPCGEHHRPPECAIDQDGNALCSCGCRWDDVFGERGHVDCCWSEDPE